MTYAVGVDIGGTKVAIAIVGKFGEIIEKTVISTDLTISPEAMITRINKEIQHVIMRSNVQVKEIIGIGIGAPGPLDSKNGMITCPPNLKKWIDIPIKQLIEQDFSIPVRLENDANVAALAEKWIGAAKDNNNYTYITVSTGIGAGIYADGKLLRGLKGNAGDIGHTVIDPSFGRCSCGQYGCLESIASGTAIAKRSSEIIGKNVSTKEVFALYREGNEKVIEYIDKVLRVLGVACVSVINTFDSEKVVIGGGVSKVGDILFDPIRSYVSKYALNPKGRRAKIVPAKLKQDAGLIGAAALYFEVM